MTTFIRLFFIPVLTALMLSGCYINHDLSRYPSREKFYEAVNDISENSRVEVLTRSDSLIIAEEGAEIINDTLSIIQNEVSRTAMVIPISLLGSIQYKNYDSFYLAADIQLKDGSSYEAEGVNVFPDSMRFLNVLRYETRTLLPASEIKRVTYNKHWLALPGGLLAGALGGFLAGYLVPYYEGAHGATYTSPGPGRSRTIGPAVLYGFYGGAIIGSIVGYLIGFDYDYNFDR